MSNVTPRGLDISTGQGKYFTSLDVLTDIEGNPIAVSSVINLGSNTQSLAGNVTLSDSSDSLHYLLCNGTDRTVTLPTNSAANKLFYIFNIGVSGDLLVGVGFIRVPVGFGVRCFSNGTDSPSGWVVEELGPVSFGAGTSTMLGYNIYQFGGRVNTDTDYLWANGQPVDTPTGTATDDVFQPILAAGTLTSLSWHSENSFSASSIEIFINGIAATFVDGLIGRKGTVAIPDSLTVIAGDTVSMRHNTAETVDPNDITMHLVVRTSVPKSIYSFGGSGASSTGDYFRVNENATSGAVFSNTLAANNEHTIARAGTATALSYYSDSGDSTTQIAIVKNGSVSETVLLSSGSGSVSLSTSFAAGDTMALEYDAGTNPNNTILNVELQDASNRRQDNYAFGGDPTAGSIFYVVNANPDNATSETGSVASRIEQRVAAGGSIVTSWRQTASGTGTFELFINGASAETFGDLSTTDGTATITSIVATGDLISVATSSGATTPGAAGIIISVRVA